MRYFFLAWCMLIAVQAQAQESKTLNKGDSQRYFSAGLADGGEQATAVHAFNPSTTESLQLTLSAFDNFGDPQMILPENSGALSPLLTNQVMVTLSPLETYTMVTQNVGAGRDIGSIEVDASGEVALWQRKQSRASGIVLKNHQTQSFVKAADVVPEYGFPIALAGTSDRLPEASSLGLRGEPVGTTIFVKNTGSLTALVRVHARDALLGTNLGSYDIDLDPHATYGEELITAFPNILTGNVSLRTELIGGEAFPFLGFRRGIENLDYVGTPVETPDGKTDSVVEMPFFQYGQQELQGFITFNNLNDTGSYAGNLNITLTPDQASTMPGFIAGALVNVFLATQNLVDEPNQRNYGWVKTTIETGQANIVSILSARDTRAIIQPVQPLARRASFPVDGRWPWDVVYPEAALMVKRTAPGMGVIQAVLLDGDSRVLDIVPLEIFEGITSIPADVFVDDAGEVRTVLLELEDANKQATYAGFFVFGGDPGLGTRLVDMVPVQSLSGLPQVARLGAIYESWESELDSCLGSQLNIGNIIGFINDPSLCP